VERWREARLKVESALTDVSDSNGMLVLMLEAVIAVA
jgi:hypothetical protein